jgi:transposase-like protein
MQFRLSEHDLWDLYDEQDVIRNALKRFQAKDDLSSKKENSDRNQENVLKPAKWLKRHFGKPENHFAYFVPRTEQCFNVFRKKS